MGNLCGKCFHPSSSQNGSERNVASAKKNNELPEPPKQSDIDPRLPLNARQKFLISKSWKGIERALTPTAVSMFIKLFEENDEMMSFFKKFENLKSKDDKKNSEELAEHATNVMCTIHNAICSLDFFESFITQLRLVGAFHYKIDGFKPDYFWKIEKPFLDAVKETLDDRYTENMEVIYKIIIKLILENLVIGYQEGKEMVENGKSLPTKNQILEN